MRVQRIFGAGPENLNSSREAGPENVSIFSCAIREGLGRVSVGRYIG